MGSIVVLMMSMLFVFCFMPDFGLVNGATLELQVKEPITSDTLLDFTTFKEKMAVELKINVALLDTKVVKDYYDSNIKGTSPDMTASTLASILLSALCSSCGEICACLYQYGCTNTNGCT